MPREHLRVIHDQAERAGRIVRNLLTFARKGCRRRARSISTTCRPHRAAHLYELQLHGIELESADRPRSVLVLGDRHELQQVLLNLMTNAVQAVSTLDRARGAVSGWRSPAEDGDAVLRVRDNGPGVPPHLVPHPVHSVLHHQEPRPGHRLGLSLSYGLVKAHGGTLVYEAPPEAGAEFRVTLPAHDAPGPLPEPEASRPAGSPGASWWWTTTRPCIGW
jgi:two-component system NtrC family sensor kinase